MAAAAGRGGVAGPRWRRLAQPQALTQACVASNTTREFGGAVIFLVFVIFVKKPLYSLVERIQLLSDSIFN